MLDWDNRGYHQQLNRYRRMTPNKTLVTDGFNKNFEKRKEKLVLIGVSLPSKTPLLSILSSPHLNLQTIQIPLFRQLPHIYCFL